MRGDLVSIAGAALAAHVWLLAAAGPVAAGAQSPDQPPQPEARVGATEPAPAAEPEPAEAETPTDDSAAPEHLAAPADAAQQGAILTLERVDFSVELGAEYEQRRVKTSFDGNRYETRQNNKNYRFEEIGRISLEGATADPDLLSYTGAFGFGGVQERFYESFNGQDQDRTSDGGLLDFDFRLDFLRTKKISGSVFGVQKFDRYARPFLPSLRERRTEYGAWLTYNDDVLPMEWRWEHRDIDRDGDSLDLDNERVVEDLFQYSATWNHRPNHTARLDVEYDDRTEQYSGSRYQFDTNRYQMRLEDSLTFGPDNSHRLDSVVRYQDESGDLGRDLFEAGPRLTLTHSPQLQSHYQYQYSRERVAEIVVEQNRLDAGFVHQLFTNLTTTGNLFGLTESVTNDVETQELGGALDWNYVKDNALGTFSADLGLTHELERVSGEGLRLQFAESATFRDPLPVTLARAGAFLPSVVVWNSTRTRRFSAGADYLIVQAGDRILLWRQLLGRIRNNESVSIDYVYVADANAKRRTTRVDFRLQQAFKNGWTPYYAMELREEDRDRSQGSPLTENDLNRHRVGVRYQRPRWAAGAEFEALHDEIDPFDAYRLFGEANLLNRAALTLDSRLDFSHFFFDRNFAAGRNWFGFGGDDNRDVILVEGSLDARYELNQRLSGVSRLAYRYEDDRSRGTVHGLDLEAGAEFQWGPYTMSATIEYDMLNIVNSRDDGLGVWLRVRRDFTGLLAQR